jgi:hypothetical protein
MARLQWSASASNSVAPERISSAGPCAACGQTQGRPTGGGISAVGALVGIANNGNKNFEEAKAAKDNEDLSFHW